MLSLLMNVQPYIFKPYATPTVTNRHTKYINPRISLLNIEDNVKKLTMINGDNCKNTVKNTNGSIFCLYIRFIFYSLAGGLTFDYNF